MAIGKKILLDTNFWLRYALVDNPNQYTYVLKLMEQIEEGVYLPYISATVFLEIYFMMSRFYKKTNEQVVKYLNLILSVRNIVIIDKTNFKKSFLWHQKYNIKLPDCLIASSLPENCTLVTWDKDFDKIKEIKVITPDKLVI